MPRKPLPSCFRDLCTGLQIQDALVIAGGPEQLVGFCIEFVRQGDRAALKAFISETLATKTAAEIKGMFKRERLAIGFRTSGGSKLFLEEVMRQL